MRMAARPSAGHWRAFCGTVLRDPAPGLFREGWIGWCRANGSNADYHEMLHASQLLMVRLEALSHDAACKESAVGDEGTRSGTSAADLASPLDVPLWLAAVILAESMSYGLNPPEADCGKSAETG